MNKILPVGSIEGKTFSGDAYNYVRECKDKGFHLGDLSWSDWYNYLYGSPEGGGEYVRDYVVDEVPDDVWSISEMEEDDEDENWY